MKRSLLLIFTLGLLQIIYAKDRDRNASTTPTLTEKVISAGFNHTLIIQEGKVYGWGENTYGQLGDVTMSSTGSAIKAIGLDHVIAVSAGRRHSLALTANGKVYAWGDNTFSQLGTTGGGTSPIPVEVVGVTDIIDIQAGDFHCLALKSDGTVVSWGSNGLGELGRGFTSSSETPGNVVDVSGSGNLTRISLISAGTSHSLAILNGQVLAWGDNRNTQLGKSPSITYRSRPDFITTSKFFSVSRLSNITSLSAGETHSLAIDTEGKLFSWGEGVYGQLGIGGPIDATDAGTYRRRNAREVASRVRTMAAGYKHSTFIDSKGKLHFFGANFHGQLGVSSSITRVLKDSTAGFDHVVALACGADFTLLLKSDGSIMGAGDNVHGQIGTPLSPSISKFNTFYNKVDRIAQVATQDNSYILKSDGTVWAMGRKEYVGFSTSIDIDTATHISTLKDIIAIAGTNGNAFALNVAGEVFSWGENESGVCGHGTPSITLYTNPTKITSLNDIIYIDGTTQGDYGCCKAAYSHASAIDVNGDLYMWGQNTHYELGDGTSTRRFTPVLIAAAGKVFSTTLGRHNSFALYANNKVQVWGRRDNAGVSRSLPTYLTSPTPLLTTTDIKSIKANLNARLAITTAGNVLLWGSASYYSYPGFFDICQVGYRKTGVALPTFIHVDDVSTALIENVKFVTLGHGFAFFIKADGSTWSWGRNNYGQLGRGYKNVSEPIPQTINCSTSGYGVSMYTAIAAEEHVLANEATVAIKSWGPNDSGQLGHGYISPSNDKTVLACAVAAKLDPFQETIAIIPAKVLMYPNPVSETLYIDLSKELVNKNMNFRLIDTSGKTVYSKSVKSSTIKLQMSDLKDGIYILELGTGIKRRILVRH